MSSQNNVSLAPRLSEQTHAMSQDGVYVFVVPLNSTKTEIANAVTDQYDVTVETVNTARLKGKPKSSFRKQTRAVRGKRADSKKAYVRLKKGDSITLFEGVS